ncbi:hypothetical protein [Dolichospermum circinale]|uniref:hypothetical protein n=1 Tax=Dolichospermum circinale TaxID=109265 RepID=UPI00232BA253|nr:hypothetical protein [Dolichospermum circinale]MDB9456384.1 hypothetical protein [Dolichospermum circinale CS-541/06]MDB9462981.1 hypothetical protein [Dolichospermum circinale CS-541/04]
MMKQIQEFIKTIKWLNRLRIANEHKQIDIQSAGYYKHNKVIVGKLLSKLNSQVNDINSLDDVEFQVFSQFGDDGIIQYLVKKIPNLPKTFVEFGVENYVESNTRFLLINNLWSGLVIDGNAENINYIHKDIISTLFNLTSFHTFVTAENINEVLNFHNLKGTIGLMSIDIDGMDYWVWKSLTIVEPIILIIEYNSIFGNDQPFVVPYDPLFNREKAHPSRLYWGASLPALYYLGKEKGYSFIGCNSNGNNAYFIKTEHLGNIKSLNITEGFVNATFNEYCRDGQTIRGDIKQEVIKGMPVYNTISMRNETL